MIENVVKAFLIQLDFFPWKSKFFSEISGSHNGFCKAVPALPGGFQDWHRSGASGVLSKGGVGEDLLPAAFLLLCPLRIQLPQRMVIKCKKAAPFPPGKTEASPVQADGTIPPQIKAFLQKNSKTRPRSFFSSAENPHRSSGIFSFNKISAARSQARFHNRFFCFFPGKRGEGTGSETEYADIPVSVLRDFSPRHG